MRFSVIPAKAGIQCLPTPTKHLDSGFDRSDDLLGGDQTWKTKEDVFRAFL